MNVSCSGQLDVLERHMKLYSVHLENILLFILFNFVPFVVICGYDSSN